MKYLLVIYILFINLISYSQVGGTLTVIYFDFDSYELSEKSKRSIDSELELFNETSEIELTGYADIVGNVAYNLKLSQKRSHSVELYLISKGILAENIVKSEGKGERDEYNQLYKNRAVEISSSTQHIVKKPIQTIIEKKKTEVIEVEKDVVIIEPDTQNVEVKSLSNDINQLEVGETIAVKGLNFIPGRHILLRSSESKLYELLDILQANPTLKIEIQGHICCSRDGRDGYDVDTDTKLLSLNRAINIYNYLVEQGIHPNRLSYKGFGPSQPLVEEIDEWTRQMNRRVEIKILEK